MNYSIELFTNDVRRGNAPFTDRLYWSIIGNDFETFKAVANGSLNDYYIQEIVRRDRVHFLDHLQSISFIWNVRHISYAAYLNRLDCMKFLYDYGCQADSTTITGAAVVNNLDMFRLIYEKSKDLFTNIPLDTFLILGRESRLEILTFLYQNGIKMPSDMVDNIKTHEKESGKDMQEVLYLLHNFGVEYDWGCEKKSCLYCNITKKDIVYGSWIMEVAMYESTIQWLPMEIMEDVLDLIRS